MDGVINRKADTVYIVDGHGVYRAFPTRITAHFVWFGPSSGVLHGDWFRYCEGCWKPKSKDRIITDSKEQASILFRIHSF